MNFKTKYNLFGIPASIVILFGLGVVTGVIGTLLAVLFLFLFAYLLFLWVYSLVIWFFKSLYSDSQNSFIFYCSIIPAFIVIAFLLVILIKHGPASKQKRRHAMVIHAE